MQTKRRIIQIDNPEIHPGFLGPGHTARSLIRKQFAESDPFILLMDDVIDKKDTKPVGGPHPHAGFETVTLLLEGEMGDDTHTMKQGDFQLMTAGSGVIHSEKIDKKIRVRTLQLWLNLPKKDRSVAPKLQDLPAANVPSIQKNGLQIKLYSGVFAGLISPVQNYTTLVMAEITMQPGIHTIQQIPANFNTFIYVISGDINVGEEKQLLYQNQVGWLNLLTEDEPSQLKIMTDEKAARFILYAGQPLGEAIVSRGPFVADNSEDITRLFMKYRQGKMKNISDVQKGEGQLL